MTCPKKKNPFVVTGPERVIEVYQSFYWCNIFNNVILLFHGVVFCLVVFFGGGGVINLAIFIDLLTVRVAPLSSNYNPMQTIKYNIKYNTDLLRNHLRCVIVTVCPVWMGRFLVLFYGNIYVLLFVIFRCFRVGFILHIHVYVSQCVHSIT